MQEINEENIDELVKVTSDPDTLKELILYAVAQNREDLIEAILDKSIKTNRLIDKLQEYEQKPISISFLGDDLEDDLEDQTDPAEQQAVEEVDFTPITNSLIPESAEDIIET